MLKILLLFAASLYFLTSSSFAGSKKSEKFKWCCVVDGSIQKFKNKNGTKERELCTKRKNPPTSTKSRKYKRCALVNGSWAKQEKKVPETKK